jgi:DnaJ-domain-containing protein 1
MEDYYQILEVSPQATFAELKSSYRLLCKEYHPDKLPPGTPEKARHYIEERFKQINQAYSILSNELARKEYDAQNSHPVSQPETNTHSKYPTTKEIFDAERLKQVAQRLELRKQQIEREYKLVEKEIDRSVKRMLLSLGYKEELGYEQEYLKGETPLKKLAIFLISLLNTLAGLWFMGLGNANLIFVLIGGAWAGYWLLYGIVVIFIYSTLNKKIAQQVKRIRKQAELEKLKAKQQRDQQLSDFRLAQRQRIDFFRYIPIITISHDYISGLSDEDQFYLLQAISERKDRDKLSQNIQKTVSFITQLGLLAILFGLGNDL